MGGPADATRDRNPRRRMQALALIATLPGDERERRNLLRALQRFAARRGVRIFCAPAKARLTPAQVFVLRREVCGPFLPHRAVRPGGDPS